MGCWNHTCAITNLPIQYHEEVEVILLKSTPFPQDTSFCHPGTYWQPIPLTFQGTYNDYGAVENCEGVALPTILTAIRDNLTELEIGENEYHDIEVKKEDFDIDFLFEADHEGRLYIINDMRMGEDSPKNLRVKHIVVRKDVYDVIAEKTTVEWWRGNSKHKLSNLDREQFTKDLDELLNATGQDELMKIRAMFRGIGESVTNDFLGYEGQGVVGINRPINVIEVLKDVRENRPDTYDGLLDNALRFAMFNHFMVSARKSWTVPSGMGSQDDSTKSQELCARLTLSSAKAQRKWNKEQYEE